jgi:hypothetical protein
MTARARALSALAAFAIALIIVTPFVFDDTYIVDEEQYIWSGAYFGGKAAQLDFSPTGADVWTDPGWSPTAWWSLTQPMGTRLVYSVALGLSSAEAPQLPHFLDDPDYAIAGTRTPPGTLLLCRVAAVLAAAAGLAMMAWRLGPRALIMVVGFLATPHVHVELARAWAEGPLLLGFGLCLLTYRTRWFPVACGVAATCKLTALGLWPLLLLPDAAGSFRRWQAAALTLLVWTVLTPPAWFAAGPFYVVNMLVRRVVEFEELQATFAGSAEFYFPVRYFWPFELAAFLGCLWLSRWAAQALERRRHTAVVSVQAIDDQGGGRPALKRSAYLRVRSMY